jgi:hypothetical protein
VLQREQSELENITFYASVWKLKKNITCPPTTTGLDIGYPGPDSAPERAVRIGEYYILPSKWKLKKNYLPSNTYRFGYWIPRARQCSRKSSQNLRILHFAIKMETKKNYLPFNNYRFGYWIPRARQCSRESSQNLRILHFMLQ